MAQVSEPLEIVFHPAKAHPMKAAMLAFSLGIGIQAIWQLVEPLTAVALCLLVIASVRDFYLETRTQLSADGIAVRGFLKASRIYPWRRFRAFVEDRNGLFLTPYRVKRRTESARGVFFPMKAEERRLAVDYCLAQELVRRAR